MGHSRELLPWTGVAQDGMSLGRKISVSGSRCTFSSTSVGGALSVGSRGSNDGSIRVDCSKALHIS